MVVSTLQDIAIDLNRMEYFKQLGDNEKVKEYTDLVILDVKQYLKEQEINWKD